MPDRAAEAQGEAAPAKPCHPNTWGDRATRVRAVRQSLLGRDSGRADARLKDFSKPER